MFSQVVLTRYRGPFGLPLGTGLLTLLAAAVVCGSLAFALGQAGTVGVLAGTGGLVLILGLFAVRNKSLLLMVALVFGLQVVFHKSIGPQSAFDSGGPLAIYVTSLDILVLALYGLWLVHGDLFKDLRPVLARPIFLVPFLGGLAQVPSIVMAQDSVLVWAELLRMAFGFALYVYVAHRVQTRGEVAILLAALLAMAVMQAAFVALEWRSGSSLGLGVLGEESNLTTRSLDDGEIPRPSGTAPHPDIMAALVAPVALIGLSLAINLRASVSLRLLILGLAMVASTPLILAQTRGAVIGEVVAGGFLIGFGLLRKRLAVVTLVAALGTAGLVAFILRDDIASKIFASAGTDHFQLEVQSRLELNGVALDMIRQFPLLGVGLNNFQTVMDHFDTYGLIFAGNPVHNLFLLVFSETGIVGLAGLVATTLVLIRFGFRTALLRDPLLSGVGAGVVAVYVFFLLEEQLFFALRHDMPRTLYWLLAGLVIACWRIAQNESRESGVVRAA